MRAATQRVVPPALDLFDPRCPKVRPSRAFCQRSLKV
jgi:hypothetical protein